MVPRSGADRDESTGCVPWSSLAPRSTPQLPAPRDLRRDGLELRSAKLLESGSDLTRLRGLRPQGSLTRVTSDSSPHRSTEPAPSPM